MYDKAAEQLIRKLPSVHIADSKTAPDTVPMAEESPIGPGRVSTSLGN